MDDCAPRGGTAPCYDRDKIFCGVCGDPIVDRRADATYCSPRCKATEKKRRQRAALETVEICASQAILIRELSTTALVRLVLGTTQSWRTDFSSAGLTAAPRQEVPPVDLECFMRVRAEDAALRDASEPDPAIAALLAAPYQRPRVPLRRKDRIHAKT